MLFNNKIDMIIPVYNTTYEQMLQCLLSLASQTIKEDVRITIVDDASPKKEYMNAISKFENYLDINLIVLEKNVGPGAARQYAIDHTENEYIMFSDSDDMWSSGFALQILRDNLQIESSNIMCSGGFQEMQYNPNNDSIIMHFHEQDTVWVFGKIYRRDFLEKYDIRFHPTSRANEDAGFNMLCKLYSSEEEKIVYIPECVYYWCYSSDSIVRRNNREYSFSSAENASFYGYIENMTYVILKCLNDKNFKNIKDVYNQTTISMCIIYFLYLDIINTKNDEHIQKCYKHAKNFYDNVYCLVNENNRLEEIFKELYYKQLNEGTEQDKILYGIGFDNFIKLMQEK